MNKTSHLLTLGAALWVAPLTATTFAQSTWQTMDVFTMGQSGAVFGMAAADNGVVFSAGGGSDAAGLHAYVRRSLDGGTNWSQVLQLPTSGLAYGVTVGRKSGLVFATAGTTDTKKAGWGDWLTLRSADGGATWTTVDFLSAPSGKADPYAVVEDAAGRVFVGGNLGDLNNTDHFLIRRSLDGGTTWTTVDNVAKGLNVVRGMVATPAGVFAAGYLGKPFWTVRCSTDGGNTWRTVDTVSSVPAGNFSAGGFSHAFGIAADAAGNLYTVGDASFVVNNVVKYHWLTRKSADGGATWRTVDEVIGDTTYAGANAVTVDKFGTVFTGGNYQSVSGGTTNTHWSTRVSVDAGATWATSDDLIPGIPMAAASDAVGNVFIGGKVKGPISNVSAGVRKLAAP